MSDELLLIPGPIMISEKVQKALGTQSLSHTSPEFVSIFQSALKDLRSLFKSTNPEDQAFVISGSGTLGWDITGANLVLPGENVLVLSTGFFSDSFAECLQIYGAEVDVLRAPLGDIVDYDVIRKTLADKKYAVITITHVDTSTAVVSDVGKIAEIVHEVSPETLIVVDGVCSVGVENIEFSKWNLDYVLTASQKAVGVPSGLSISFMSKRALHKSLNRQQDVSFFASVKRWFPIMQNYESGKPSYFATPAIQLVNALKASLDEMLHEGKSLDDRYAKHHKTSVEFKNALKELGIKLVSVDPATSANGLTAAYFPEGVDGPEFIKKVTSQGIVIAGGIHKDIRTKYFRVGHMGVSALDDEKAHIPRALQAIKNAL